MNHDELEESVPLYAVGALERTERQALEAHLLSGCPSCHASLKEYQSVAAILPFGLMQNSAPRPLKAKIMAARGPLPAAQDAGLKQGARPSLEPGEWMNHLFPPEAPTRPVWLLPALGIAAFLLAGGALYLAWTYYGQLTQDTTKFEQLQTALHQNTVKITALQREIKERNQTLTQVREELNRRTNDMADLKDVLIQREAELDDLRAQVETMAQRRGRPPQEEFVALLRAPGAKVVSLTGLEMAKEAGAVLVYDANVRKGWLYAYNMPSLSGGKVYQLWIVDDRPISAGIFTVDSGRKGRLLIRNLPDMSRTRQFAVSVEPAGGRPQPTGAIYLLGQL